MNSPASLCELGHVARTRDLRAAGYTRHDIARLAAFPGVHRVHKGVYACRHLGFDEQIAAHTGARLDCVSVLARHGVWVGHSGGLHVRMPPGAGDANGRLAQVRHVLERADASTLKRTGIPSGAAGGAPRIRAHWSQAGPGGGDRLEVPIADALRQAMSCLPPDDLIAALESARYLRLITRGELEALIADAPSRLHAALTEVVDGPQSGYETLSRLRLQRAGHAVVPQVPIPGMGHLDNLIDDVVGLETDGFAIHAETFFVDRERDLITESWGIRVLRIPAVYVDTRWDEVAATVERMVAEALRARRSGPRLPGGETWWR